MPKERLIGPKGIKLEAMFPQIVAIKVSIRYREQRRILGQQLRETKYKR